MQMVSFPLKEAAVCIRGSLHVHANLAVCGGSVATCEVKDTAYFLKKINISKHSPACYLQVSEMELLLNVMQLLLLRLNVGLQDARPLLQLLLQLVHYAELRLLQLIHGGLWLRRRLRLRLLLKYREEKKRKSPSEKLLQMVEIIGCHVIGLFLWRPQHIKLLCK